MATIRRCTTAAGRGGVCVTLTLLVLVTIAGCGGGSGSGSTPARRTLDVEPAAVTLSAGGQYSFTVEDVSAEVGWRTSGGRILVGADGVVFFAPDEPGAYTVTASAPGFEDGTVAVTVAAPIGQESESVATSGGAVRSDAGAELHLDSKALQQRADVLIEQYDAPSADSVEGSARIGDAVRIKVPREALDLASGSGVIVRVPPFDTGAGAALAEVRIRTASGERVTTYLPYDPKSDLGDAVLVPAEMLAAIDASDGLSDPVDLFVQPLDVAGVTTTTASMGLGPQRIDYVEGLFRVAHGDSSELVRNCSADSQVASADWVKPVSGTVEATGKTPLVFVHGWQVLGDRSRQAGTLRAPLLCSWDTIFLELFRQGFDDRFDIYTFGYDSELGYEEGGAELTRLLSDFETPPVLIGHSNGGLVIRNAVAQGAAFEHAYLVASPQLGSPALVCTRVSDDGERCASARMHPLLWSAVGAATAVGEFALPGVETPSVLGYVTNLEYAIAQHQGTRDLAWHEPITVPGVGDCGFFLCRESVLFPGNPVHDEAQALSPSDYERITAVYGNLSAGSGGAPPMRAFNSLFFENLGYQTDQIVPVVSASVVLDGVTRVGETHELPGADHGTVKGGSLGSPFENLLTADGSVDCRVTDLEQQRACEALARLTSLLWRHAPEQAPEPLSVTSFGAFPDSVAPDEPVTFRAAIGGGAPPRTCRLDADDDGTVDVEQRCDADLEATASYPSTGAFRPRLEVTDADGTVVTARADVEVVTATTDRVPYVTEFTARPTVTFAGTPVEFAWTVVDPEGATVSCSLDANGDGVVDHHFADCADPGVQEHVYATEGEYVATLRVSDGAHEATAQAPSVRVEPEPAGVVTWSVAPDMLIFDGAVGGSAPAGRSFELTNAGTTEGEFSLGTTSMVTVTPVSGRLAAGESATIDVDVTACAGEGTTTSTITVDGGGSSASLAVGRECGATEPTSGYLQVTIRGLPDGARPDVLITNGDGVFYRPTSSLLIPDVPADSYDVTVESVSHDGVVYRPLAPPGSVTVNAGATATLEVAYEADAPEVAEWRIEPTLLGFEGEAGSSAPPAQILTLHNDGTATGTFAASATSMVQIQPGSGTVAPGGSTSLTVTVAACPSTGTSTRTLLVDGSGDSVEASIVRSCLAQEAYLAYQQQGDGAGYVEIDTSSGGVTTCSSDCLRGPYQDGDEVALRAVPAAGSTFAGWGGACAGAGGTTCVATLQGSATLFAEASFQAERHDLTIDVYNVSDFWPPAGALVELCRDMFFNDCIGSQHTDAAQRVRFTDVPADGYSFRVTSHPDFAPSHVEYWGSGTVDVDSDTTIGFMRSWPYLASYAPTCRDGRVELEVTLRNPGSADKSMYVGMIADRDQLSPYDADTRNANFALPPGSDVTVTLSAAVQASGTYHLYLYASDRHGRVTDQVEPWANSCSF